MKTSGALWSLAAIGCSLAASLKSQTFDVMALRSASPIHFAHLSAANGGLFLNLFKQGAKCSGESGGNQNRATLYIDNSILFLYSHEEKKQVVFVDRSVMGQGKIGYIIKGSKHPATFEFEGWSINADGNLVFKNRILQACPSSKDDFWTIWVTDFVNPSGKRECLGFSPRSLPNDKPVSCVYS